MRCKSWFVLLLVLFVAVAVVTPGADAHRDLIGAYEGDLEPRGGGDGTDDGGDPDGVGLENPEGEQFGPTNPMSAEKAGSSGAAACGGVTFQVLHFVITTADQLIW